MTRSAPLKYALIGVETTWGTGVTADKDLGLIKANITDTSAREIIESQGISSLESQAINTGMRDSKFSVDGEFQHGRLLEGVFGSVAHAETTGDWKHTFTSAAAGVSYTIESGINNSANDVVFTHTGALIDVAEIRCALNQNLTAKYDFLGKKSDPDGTTASSASESTLIVFPHPMVHVSINGSEASEVQEASIKISKKVMRSGGMGSEEYQQGNPTELKFEFTAKLGFSDETYHALADANTSHNFEINAHNAVTLGSGRRELKITLTDCLWSNFEEITTVGDLIYVNITGRGTLSEAFSVDNISSANW